MRYYSIVIDGAPANFPARYDNGAQWGTTLNGIHDPNAQQIDFQLQAFLPTNLGEGSVLTVHGVSWDQIQTCNQLVGKPITVYGGMSPGLPLATLQSQRPKLLVQGKILKCWGNWIANETSIGFAFQPAGDTGTTSSSNNSSSSSSSTSSGDQAASSSQQSLTSTSRYNRAGGRSLDRRAFKRGPTPTPLDPLGDLAGSIGGFTSDSSIAPAFSQFGNVVNSFFGGGNINPLSAPLNIIHNMQPNVPMSSAIQQTLSKVFPNAKLDIRISPMLKLAYQDAGIYQSIEQYAGLLQKLSQSILGSNKYPGIHIAAIDNTLRVLDFSQPFNQYDISYMELVGQPTWIGPFTISVKIVLRGGLNVGDDITLPQTLVGFGGADSMVPGEPDQRSHVSLPGTYRIMKILHIGDFRNPDGSNWTTQIEANSQGSITNPEATQPPVQQPQPQTQTDISIRPPPGGFPQPQSTRLITRSVRTYG